MPFSCPHDSDLTHHSYSFASPLPDDQGLLPLTLPSLGRVSSALAHSEVSDRDDFDPTCLIMREGIREAPRSAPAERPLPPHLTSHGRPPRPGAQQSNSWRQARSIRV
jgi:hypothetical protein